MLSPIELWDGTARLTPSAHNTGRPLSHRSRPVVAASESEPRGPSASKIGGRADGLPPEFTPWCREPREDACSATEDRRGETGARRARTRLVDGRSARLQSAHGQEYALQGLVRVEVEEGLDHARALTLIERNLRDDVNIG
jgi:hypothetical protein